MLRALKETVPNIEASEVIDSDIKDNEASKKKLTITKKAKMPEEQNNDEDTNETYASNVNEMENQVNEPQIE